jgi:hypothetical protein
MRKRENQSTRSKTSPSATLCAMNPTWTGLELNPGLRGNRPMINCLNHGTVFKCCGLRNTIRVSNVLYSSFVLLLQIPRSMKQHITSVLCHFCSEFSTSDRHFSLRYHMRTFVLELTYPPTQWTRWALSLVMQRPERDERSDISHMVSSQLGRPCRV